jgi:hypothetical protein
MIKNVCGGRTDGGSVLNPEDYLKTLVTVYQAGRSHIPEGSSLHSQCRENVQDKWVEEQVNKQPAQLFAPCHISILKSISIKFINSVRTSQETHYVSATKPNRLMLFRQTVAVY